jgi:hypothetical protein
MWWQAAQHRQTVIIMPGSKVQGNDQKLLDNMGVEQRALVGQNVLQARKGRHGPTTVH